MPPPLPPDASTGALLLGTLTISLLHALIPSHWLSFALVGKARKWSVGRTLQLTLWAGAGHVAVTILLGLLVSIAGKSLWHLDKIPERTEHLVTSTLLILLGLWFIRQQRQGVGCAHDHHHDYSHTDVSENTNLPVTAERVEGVRQERLASATTTGALFLGMTLSPCLDLLSVFIAASRSSWATIAGVSLTMAVVTLSSMLTLVLLAHKGLERVRFGWLERNEGYAVGGALVGLGILLFLL